MATATFGAGLSIPGSSGVNGLAQFQPQNAPLRSSTLNGEAMNNGLPKMPLDFNQGLKNQLLNLRQISDTFEQDVAILGFTNYRGMFAKDTLPTGTGSLSKVYMKDFGMDESPETAGLVGLFEWNQTLNEVSTAAVSIEITCTAWARFYKFNRMVEEVSLIDWKSRIAARFASNANNTLNNLAGYRLYEGSQKLFVNSVATFDPKNPYAARLTLGADASTVDSYLTIVALKEAVYLMENYKQQYVVVQKDGTIKKESRISRIPGNPDGSYTVKLGRNGHRQIMQDPDFTRTFVETGGHYQESVVDGSLGVTSPVFGLKFELVDNPLTITKEASPKASSTGAGALECAFVVGNGGVIGYELSLAGSTKMINVGYEEDKKVDPLSMLSFTAWMAVVDFGVINNEALICIPYKKATNVISGNVVVPAEPSWKE